MKMLNSRQGGFTLVEILLVIGLIGAIAIGAFVVFPMVQMSQNVSEMSTRALSVSASTHQFFGGRSFTGLNNSTAISAGILGPNETTTPWGNMNISASSSGNEFQLEFTRVPSGACLRLLEALNANSNQLRVGSRVVKEASGAFNFTTAASACASASNTIIFFPKTN